MFSRCANPECATPFEYHLGGKFYRFRQDEHVPERERNMHAVVHFWLCPRCAEVFSLDYDGTHCLLIQTFARSSHASKAALQITNQEEGLADRGDRDARIGYVTTGREKGAR
jgi:hypothetical protein